MEGVGGSFIRASLAVIPRPYGLVVGMQVTQMRPLTLPDGRLVGYEFQRTPLLVSTSN